MSWSHLDIIVLDARNAVLVHIIQTAHHGRIVCPLVDVVDAVKVDWSIRLLVHGPLQRVQWHPLNVLLGKSILPAKESLIGHHVPHRAQPGLQTLHLLSEPMYLDDVDTAHQIHAHGRDSQTQQDVGQRDPEEGFVARHKVAETNGGHGDERKVEGIHERPFNLPEWQ